jgi:exopolyphosphatase/guanosine-5'-triphosphate,3'-diphosphate pyrophosphatase
MNIAVVDIGSNSTRLLIAAREGDRLTELVRHSEVTRLGAGVDASGRLAPEAMARVDAVLEQYAPQIAAHECAAAVAVLTSAVRDSANGAQFADAIRDRFGIEPHVLSGDQEATLTYLGATSERDPADRTPTLVLDIGGAETVSVDPGGVIGIQALRSDVGAILDAAIPADLRAEVAHGVAVAGTATSLAAIAQRLDPYDPARVHGYRLSAADGDRILSELSEMTLGRRREVPGLHPDRAPTIVAGVLIFGEVVRRFGLAEIEISEHDILRGAALGLVDPPPVATGH